MGPSLEQQVEQARRTRRSPPSPAAAAWSSPAFTRPSNLRAFVRAGSSFPPTSELRSQRTQATQTRQEQSAVSGAHDVDLAAFGRVGDLPLDTVDFLLRALEDRRSELLTLTARAPVERHTPHSRSDDQQRISRRRSRATSSKPRVVDDEHTESSDTSDEPAALTAVFSHAVQQATAPLAPSAIVRSRSYEALVQLEGILEARHQQLMSDGVLEPPAAQSPSTSFVGGGAPHRSEGDRYGEAEDDEDADAGGLEMADIQEEIRKMHRSLRRRRAEQAANALDGELESLFVGSRR